jgi:hypothetical protein
VSKLTKRGFAMMRIAIATLALAAFPALAAVSDLSSQNANWAGGKSNADSLVNQR